MSSTAGCISKTDQSRNLRGERAAAGMSRSNLGATSLVIRDKDPEYNRFYA